MPLFGVFIVILFLILGVGGAIIYSTAKKNGTMMFANQGDNQDYFDSDQAENVMNIIPIKDIHNNVLETHDGKIVGYLEVASVNYRLKTNVEQDIIEDAYRDMLGVIPHDMSLIVSNRNLDTDNIVQTANVQLEETIQTFPHLKEYGELFLNAITNYSSNTNTYKKKCKYLSITIDLYGETFDDDLTDDERMDQALSMMNESLMTVRGGLIGCNIPSVARLNNHGIAALFAGVFHRDSLAIMKHFDTYSNNIVEGNQTPLANGNPFAQVRLWIHETQEKMRDGIFDNQDIEDKDKLKMTKYMKDLRDIKEDLKNE